jgi:two-component system cell cycle response regulator DivK
MSDFDSATKSRSAKARAARARQRRSTAKARQPHDAPPPTDAEAPGSAKTVLIVEDNELNMKLFNDLLEAHGYRTIQTRNGMDALPLARKHRPNLILMDIQLPEVSGLDVTKWLKEDDALKDIPVIAVTAFAMKGDEQRIREGGCEAYISKPIAVGAFLKTIDQFADKA